VGKGKVYGEFELSVPRIGQCHADMYLTVQCCLHATDNMVVAADHGEHFVTITKPIMYFFINTGLTTTTYLTA
jgi:hypothetical protein